MQCRIQFHDKDLQEFDWCKLDDTGSSVLGSGQSSSDELTAVCTDSTNTIVFFPQQDILLTSSQLPPRANKQQLNAIAYSVEESLAEDIEDCFFSVAEQQSDHTVPVAVIERGMMDEMILLLVKNHINVRNILPQIYLCPWSAADDLLATICPLEGDYLVRTGKHEGFFCNRSIFNQVVTLLAKQKSADQNRLVVYGEVMLSDLESTGLELEQREAISLLAQPVKIKSSINLKPKGYQSSNQWLGLLKYWRWPMVATVLLAVVLIAGNLLDGWQKEQLYRDIVSQQKSLLNKNLADLVVGNQPKKQLIKVLADNGGSEGVFGFVDLLHEYSQLKAGFKVVTTNKIQYQQSQLVVNLETGDLNAMESFRSRLEKSSYQAQIVNVSINPDKTTARLIMGEN